MKDSKEMAGDRRNGGESGHPKPWQITAKYLLRKNGGARGEFKVLREIGPSKFQYVLEGYSDEHAVYKRRRDAQEVVDKLNGTGGQQ